MKIRHLWLYALAAAVVFCLVPTKAPAAAPQSSPAAAQQQTAPQHLGLLLAGKVLVRHGHYDFYNTDTHSMFRIENPAKAKQFKGDTVRIQGKVDARRHTIYIYRITSYI